MTPITDAEYEALENSPPETKVECNMMSVKMLNGYWTVYSGTQPVISCVSFAAALAHIDVPAEELG